MPTINSLRLSEEKKKSLVRAVTQLVRYPSNNEEEKIEAIMFKYDLLEDQVEAIYWDIYQKRILSYLNASDKATLTEVLSEVYNWQSINAQGYDDDEYSNENLDKNIENEMLTLANRYHIEMYNLARISSSMANIFAISS